MLKSDKHIKTRQNIRFRRWSRKSYAIFSSLSCCVSIGFVCKSICNLSFKKSGSLVEFSKKNIVSDFYYEDEEDTAELLNIEVRNNTNSLLFSLLNNIPVGTGIEKSYTINPAVGISNTYFNRFFLCKLMRKIFTITCIVILVINSLSAQQDDLLIDLSEVEVKANSGKLYSESGRLLTVIEKEEIDILAVLTLDELLDYVAGLDVRQRANGGVQADVSIRGGSFDQNLILLNGINITNPQTGHYNLDIPVNLSDISRIEILQGSSARILGANAFSGAINIITEQSGKTQLGTEITAGIYNTTTQVVTGSYNKSNFNISASASHQQSDGYIKNTDYNISNGFIYLTKSRKNAGKFAIQLGAQHKKYGANGFYSLDYPNQLDQTITFLSALTWSYNQKNWRYNAQAYWRQHHDWFELFRDFENAPEWYKGHNYHQTDVAGIKITTSYFCGIGKVSFGIDLRNEHIYSNVLGKEMKSTHPVPFQKHMVFTHESNRFLTGAFLDYSKNWEHLYISLGGAMNYASDFGSHFYGGVDIGYIINDAWKLFACYNSAVRLPTFTDMYYKSATQIANPQIQPEKAQTIEAGMKYSWEKLSFDISGFYRMGKNNIDWVKEPDSIKWECRNLTSVNALGGDVTFHYDFKHNFLKKIDIIYSYVHLNKSTLDFDSKYALDYLKHKLQLSVHHQIWKKLSASWKISCNDRAGNYTDFHTSKLIDYKPYLLLDTKLRWSEKRFEVFGDLNNILNTHYSDYGGLPLPGIHCNIGIKIRIE